VRSHDLIRLLDEPGPERWARPLQISFLDLPRRHERRRGGSGKSRRARCAWRRRFRECGRFRVPATAFRAAASLSLGKLKSRRRPDSAEVSAYMVRWRPRRRATATTADDVDRIRVLTIAITAPQHEQSIGGRSLRGGLKRLGSNFSKRCSKPIRRLQLACRKPKLRARRKPLGSTCWRISQRKSAPVSERFSDLPVWRCDSGSSPGHSRRRGCPVHG
jgi:hypothetical protein